MYQYEWFDRKIFEQDRAQHIIPDFESKVNKQNIDKVLLINWLEHCHECAPPLCYVTCPLYLARKDMKCRNVFYGIYRNPRFSGLHSFGADMRFRKWGKLETLLTNINLTPKQINTVDRINSSAVNTINFMGDLLAPFDKKRKVNGALNLYRIKLLNRFKEKKTTLFDDFLIECYSFENKEFKLIIEYTNKENNYRNSVNILPGYNLVKIPAAQFNFIKNIPTGKLTIYPENDQEVRIVFAWLDFVKYTVPEKPQQELNSPAAKIKCIAWDLDNTLWKGVFIENNPSELTLNKDAVNLIKTLDEKGILQTIVSKNNHEEVWPYLGSIGLSQYFLYPAINWGQKSENLKKIAGLLNINIDTFGVIDDSAFEREEIKTALPQIRVYSDKEISTLTGRTEFDVPVTEESKNRRSYYLVEQQRNQVAESFSGDYTSFLKNCAINLTIFTPTDPSAVKRCYELILRTNQLNLSSRKYDEETFNAILEDKKYLKYAFECFDKFGSYGIVGFSIIETGADFYKIHDFVISCRVAQKMVEHAFITWLSKKMNTAGKKYLLAEYIKTNRNSPILSVFEEINFEKEAIGNNSFLLRLNVAENKLENNIITINEK